MQKGQRTPRLVLLRHAEAEAANTAASDFDRALTMHGREQALQAAHRLQRARLRPDMILASPALRARETATIVAARLECLLGLRYDAECYPGEPQVWLRLARKTDPSTGTLLLVGHNPGISDVGRRLAGGELPELSTAALLSLTFAGGGWSDIETSKITRVSQLE